MREMKDSGIEWIDEIPLDWTAKPLKWMVKFGKGLPITKDNLIEQGIPVVSYGQIHSKTNDGTHLRDDLIRFVSEAYLESNPLSLGKKGDIFFADTSEDYAGIGNAVLVDIDTPVFAGYHTVIVRPDDQSYSRYLAYLFLTDAWRSQLCSEASGIKVFSITQGLLKKTTVILPPAEKAVAMTDYLDRKCSQIDAIIARQQEVIEKLKAYKLSVITEAVTKGLNPDVPMKNSGIEWIGEIPEHWEIIKTRHIVKDIGDIDHYMPESVAAGIPYLMTGDLKDFVSEVDFDSCKQVAIDNYLKLSKKVKIEKGDLIFARYATIGTVCLVDVDKDFLVSYSCVIVKVDPNLIESKFLMYYYKSTAFLEEILKFSNANTQSNIGKDSMHKAKICTPPIKEQKEIIRYLEKKCSSIESLLKSKQAVIDKLTAYKKSLIYEVVTGKKEV